MAKRASGRGSRDMSDALFCCPRSCFKRPWKFKARNPEELSSKQRRRQVKFLSMQPKRSGHR